MVRNKGKLFLMNVREQNILVYLIHLKYLQKKWLVEARQHCFKMSHIITVDLQSSRETIMTSILFPWRHMSFCKCLFVSLFLKV